MQWTMVYIMYVCMYSEPTVWYTIARRRSVVFYELSIKSEHNDINIPRISACYVVWCLPSTMVPVAL
jgi:hypothetical protein